MKFKTNPFAAALRSSLTLGISLSFAGFSIPSALAGTNWTGTSSTDWNTAGNWGGALPVNGNAITINTNTGNIATMTANSSFKPADIFVGQTGTTGRFDIRAGLLEQNVIGTAGNWFFIGSGASTATGTVNIANTAVTGQSNLTTFGQGTGSLTVGKLWIGGRDGTAGGTGTLNINTTGSILAQSTGQFGTAAADDSTAASIIVGNGASTGVGTVNLDSGTVTATDMIWVGNRAGNGTWNQSGGTVTTSALVVARRAGTGVVTINGGTFGATGNTATGNAAADLNGGDVSFVISRGANSSATQTGTMNIGGTGIVNSTNDFLISFAGSATAVGTVNVNSGGTLNIGTSAEKWLQVNRFDSVQGRLNVDGGTVNLQNNSDIRFSHGGGTGVSFATVKNGGAITGGTGSVLDLNYAGSTGVNNTFNLDGGTLTLGAIDSTVASGTRIFNFNGGTLKAAGASTTFFGASEASAANVRNGGAIIDTTNGSVTIGQLLQHSAVSGDTAIDGGLTKNAANTLTLSNGGNTFNGNILISSGTLAAGAGITGNTAANIASALGEIGTSASRTITVNNGGTLQLTAGNTLGTGGSTGTLAGVTLVVNSGGLFQTGTNATGAGFWNKIGAVNLNGGTISVGSGANTTTFQGLALIGTVTVGGSTASTINNLGSSDSAYNGIHLGQNAGAGQAITFDVADVTGNSNTDLTISPALLNTSSNLTASGLTKIGAGTLTLTGNNAYTGTTTISAGTLQVGSGGTTGSLSSSSAITNNASLVFNRSDALTQGNAISGTGSLTKAGAGTLTLTGSNSYSGGLTISGGTVAVSTNAQTLGAGNISLANNTGLSVKAAAAGSTLLTNTGSFTLGSSGSDTTNLTFDFNNLNTTATLVSTGAFTANGTVNVSFLNGALLGNGSHALIDYTSFSGSGTFPSGSFSLGARSNGTIINDLTNTVLNLNVTSDMPKWTGLDSGAWVVGTTGASSNWKLITAGTATDYIAGDVVLFDDSAAGTTSVTINADVSPTTTTFDNTSKDYTLSGSAGIAAGSLTKNGTGTVNLGTSNSYTGGTTINAGTLNVTGSLADAGAVAVNGGTYTVGASDTVGAVTLASGTINGAGTLTASSVATQSGMISAILAGSGGLTKTTGGSVTVSGNNTYTGATTVSNGTLEVTTAINASDAAGGGAVTVGDSAGNTAVLNLNGATVNAKGANIQIGTANTATGTVNMTGGTLNTGTREMWLSTTNGANGTFNLSNGNVTVGSWLAVGRGGNNGNLNVSGGSLNVTGGNLTIASFAGNVGQTTITGGSVTTTNAVYAGEAGTGALSVSNTGSLVINGTEGLRIGKNSGSTGTVNLGTGGTINTKLVASGGTGTMNFNGGTLKAGASSTTWYASNTSLASQVQAGGAVIDTNGFDVTIADSLTHDTALGATVDGGLVKNGSGILTLTAANTFTGAVTVNGGTLYTNPGNAANNRALSFVSDITVNNGATLRSGSNGLFGWDGSQERTITVNAGGTLAADGGLGSDVGVGTVVLNGGTLATVATGATDWGSFRFDEATDKLQVTDNSTISASNVKFGNASAQLEVAAGKVANFTGTITDTTSGGISYLNKTGSGTLVLAGSNTYTGATTVSAGTLLVTGSLGNTAVTVNGGTLGGTGSIGGAVNITTGTFSPGASIQSLATGSLSMASGTTLAYEILDNSSTGADLTVVNGTLSLDNVTLSLDAGSLAALASGAFAAGDKITIFSYDGTAITSGFAGYTDDTSYFFGANEWLFNYNDTVAGNNFAGDIPAGDHNYVTLTSVPEPRVALLGGLGVLALLRRRRAVVR